MDWSSESFAGYLTMAMLIVMFIGGPIYGVVWLWKQFKKWRKS